MIIPLALILTGTLFLLRNIGLLPYPAWDIVWPLVLIIFGAAAFFRRGKKARTSWCGFPSWEDEEGKK